MGLIAPIGQFLLRFWRPIATGIGSIVAWEWFDSDETTKESSFSKGLFATSTVLLLLFVVGLFTGVINITGKKKRRR